jgi:hypothetical protein
MASGAGDEGNAALSVGLVDVEWWTRNDARLGRESDLRLVVKTAGRMKADRIIIF